MTNKNEEAQKFAQENPEAAQQVQETMEEILARSATDPSFREKLKADPRAAIEEHTGAEVQQAPDVAFVESEGDAESESQGERTVVLPDPVDSEAELSAEELEAVSGGTEVATAVALGATFALSAGAGAAAYYANDDED